MNNAPANTVPFSNTENGEAVNPVLKPKNQYTRLAVSLIPFTPVPWADPLAWVRLGVYGSIAVMTYNRIKPISYIAMGAGAVAVATSLAGGYWKKENGDT